MPKMLAAFTSITGVLWEKVNEGGGLCGKDCALYFSQVILIYILFQSLFLLTSFSWESVYFSLHLKVFYSASNFIFLLKFNHQNIEFCV